MPKVLGVKLESVISRISKEDLEKVKKETDKYIKELISIEMDKQNLSESEIIEKHKDTIDKMRDRKMAKIIRENQYFVESMKYKKGRRNN